MSRLFLGRIYDRSAVLGDVLDAQMKRVLEILNGGLDAQNFARGVKLSASYFLEKYSILVFEADMRQGTAFATPVTSVILGIVPPTYSFTVYRASAIVAGASTTPSGDVTLLASATALGTLKLAPAPTVQGTMGKVARADLNAFPSTAVVAAGDVLRATLPGSVDYVHGKVSIALKVAVQS